MNTVTEYSYSEISSAYSKATGLAPVGRKKEDMYQYLREKNLLPQKDVSAKPVVQKPKVEIKKSNLNDAAFARILHEEINAALRAITDKYGLELGNSRASFGDDRFNKQIKITSMSNYSAKEHIETVKLLFDINLEEDKIYTLNDKQKVKFFKYNPNKPKFGFEFKYVDTDKIVGLNEIYARRIAE